MRQLPPNELQAFVRHVHSLPMNANPAFIQGSIEGFMSGALNSSTYLTPSGSDEYLCGLMEGYLLGRQVAPQLPQDDDDD